MKGKGTIVKNGVVMPDKHPTDPSLYLVHIGDRTASSSGRLEDGVWCINAMSPYTRFRDINNNAVSFGSYIPLQPFTPVTITIPNGGMGTPLITGLAKTNVNVPDPENRDSLYMLAQTPKGSWIAIDDKRNNIQIMHNKGSSSVVLAENNITLELSKGDNSGKAHDTSLSLSKGSFIFKMRDAMMKMDEGGFVVGFDKIDGNEHASYLKVTRDGIEIYGNKYFKLNTDEYATMNSREITIEGTKDASFLSNHVKVNGTQLTSIKGNQIELEGFWNVQLKGMHIGFQATVQLTELTALRFTTITTESKKIGIYAETAGDHSLVTGALNIGATNILMDGMIVENSGGGATAAEAAFGEAEGVNEAAHAILEEVGTAWMGKNVFISTITKVLGGGPFLAGSGKTSEAPSGMLQTAKDKTNKKSINSTAATFYSRKNDALEELTIVDSLIEESMTAVNTGGQSPAALTKSSAYGAGGSAGAGVSGSLLEQAITGTPELSTKPSGSIIGMNTEEIQGTLVNIMNGGTIDQSSQPGGGGDSCYVAQNSCNIMQPDGPFASLRESIMGCGQDPGAAKAKQCGETIASAQGMADEQTSKFEVKLDLSSIEGGTTNTDTGMPHTPGHCGG
jgi:hypothetical protein